MMQCCSGWTVADDNNKLSSPSTERGTCMHAVTLQASILNQSYRAAKSLVVPLQPAMTLSPPFRVAPHMSS